jgi:hypothetical protein
MVVKHKEHYGHRNFAEMDKVGVWLSRHVGSDLGNLQPSHSDALRMRNVLDGSLVYIELVAQYSTWGIELLAERDHRNEIHKSLSERVGSPLDADTNEAIQELSTQTEKARSHHRINVIARALLWTIIMWNLFKAAFFWPV